MSWWSDRDFRLSTTKKVEKILDIIAEITKAEYERGKADAMKECGKAGRLQGEWLEVTSWEAERHSVTDMRCNICGKYASIVLPHKTCCVYDYCPNCGAQMKGADDE